MKRGCSFWWNCWPSFLRGDFSLCWYWWRYRAEKFFGSLISTSRIKFWGVPQVHPLLLFVKYFGNKKTHSNKENMVSVKHKHWVQDSSREAAVVTYLILIVNNTLRVHFVYISEFWFFWLYMSRILMYLLWKFAQVAIYLYCVNVWIL